ncbi:MAG TPA: substrate-binding domain-containing protein, partial [Clostridiales bacterium]|nr:substrate-binding domain-containing protein [Clostridiales bacterium]
MRFARRMTAALIITAAAVTAFAQKIELVGAGASFPAPLVTAMADQYRTLTDGKVTVNYQSIGSGGGIRQFGEQTIMFG